MAGAAAAEIEDLLHVLAFGRHQPFVGRDDVVKTQRQPFVRRIEFEVRRVGRLRIEQRKDVGDPATQ